MKKLSFVAFYLIWAEVMKWRVPDLHVRVCMWLEACDEPVRVLQVFRGAAKSTLYAIYKAWRIYIDPTGRSLVWSADTRLAKKMNRDVISVLRRHPFCVGILPMVTPVAEFWAIGSEDERNATMSAFGVMSNATGGRADAVDFDDIEVPKNIKSAEGREKLRERISDSTHILVPGGQKTYIGTPHTHETIYDEQIAGGAAVLKIPLFAHAKRHEDTHTATRYAFDFAPKDDGLYVFVGIGKFARLLAEDMDYRVEGSEVVFAKPPGNVIDIYAGCAWPERFDRKDLIRRRRDTPTLNAWDSQYQLHAKPLHAIRLDPDKLVPYEVLPVITEANGGVRMMLGRTQIVSAASRWDCALGRVGGDTSAFDVILEDARGHYYWHVALSLTGDIYTQCRQVREVVIRLQLPRVTVEVNGPGAFVPHVLRKELVNTGCAVVEDFSTVNKNERILDALEAPMSGRFLWAHVDVIETVSAVMKDWKSSVKEQPDDHLDAASGAIKEVPQRIGKIIRDKQAKHQQAGAWRTDGGTHEVQIEFEGRA